MVNQVLLAGVLTVAWVLFAALWVGPILAKRWRAWGEVAVFIIFTALELGMLVLIRPGG